MDGITTHNPIMDVPELIPMEDYDPYKARLQASLRWLLTKAFGNHVPTEMMHPFYDDGTGVPQLKPAVTNALTSADLYCRACAAIFRGDSHTKWEGHWSVMQALSRKGVYVVDGASDTAVTETQLLHTQPVKVAAHLALIESLMQAYIAEVVSVERVSQAVRRFSSFNASSELPYNTEDALVFWLNKVCSNVNYRAQQDLGQDVAEPVDIPLIEDLLKDINDGCHLAATISFYCPQLLPITEVAAKGNLGIADSLYNVQLVCDFCEQHIPGSLPLTVNDLFYTHNQLRFCLLAFVAELFNKFEVHRLPIARDTSKPYRIIQAGSTSPTRRRPQSGRPLISNVTKKSFQQPFGQGDLRAASASNPDLHNNSVPPPRMPLLPRRLGNRNNPNGDDQTPPRRVVTNLGLLRRSRSLTSIEDREGLRDSVQAWEDLNNQQDHVIDSSRDTGRTGSTMLANVSIDSDMSLDLTTDSSIDLSELEDTPRGQRQARGPSAPVGPVSRTRNNAMGNPRPHTGGTTRTNPGGHTDDTRLESLSGRTTSGHNPSPSRQGNNPHGSAHGDGARHASNNNGQAPLEPLLPAKLKPAKEKTSNHTKEVESGEKPEKKSPSSPNKPRTLALKSNGGGEEESSSDEEFQTPSAENVPFFDKPKAPAGSEEGAEVPQATRAETIPNPSVASSSRGRQFEAFYVDTDNPPLTSSVTANGVPPPTVSSARGLDRSKPQAQSFTLHDHAHTPEAAIAAGIPVVDGSLPKPIARRPPSRDSAGAAKGTPRSSRDKMDQELSKLNADSRNKEIKDTPRDSFFLNPSSETVQRPDTLNVPKPIQVDHPGSSVSVNGDRPSPKTSFAEIKKQKDSGEVSPVTYLQHGSPMKNTSDKPGLKSAFHKVGPANNPHSKQQKKTTFAALPNQTTWQESIQKSAPAENPDSNRNSEEGDAVQPMATELMSIRMRLEERRRQIETEKRRMELHWNKQRQRVGKQAFIAVISKGKGDGTSPEDGAASMKKTPEGASGLKGVTDSGLGGSQTEGEPDSAARPDRGEAEQEARRREAEQEARRREAEQEARRKEAEQEARRKEAEEKQREKREKERKEKEEKERRDQEERERKIREERLRKEQEEKERIENEKKERDQREREELERREREEKERELERIRKREKEKERLRKEMEERERERQRELEKEVEMELERERKRQREIEKDLELELEREKTRQAERNLELERLREKQTMLEKQLEERLRERSESPCDGSDSGRPKRPFSREGIQSLLDSGKQRWLSREGTPEMRSRPKSYAAGEGDMADFPESSFANVNPNLSSLSGLAGAKAEYGQGLDRLNTSLSDLQGEIMRLSLEQDHLKNMVSTEPRTRVQSTPPKQVPPSQPSQPPQQSRYYGMYPDPSGEPDVAGGIRSTIAGSTATSAAFSHSASIQGHPGNMYGTNQSGQYPPTHPMYGVQQHPSYTLPHTNQYGQYMPYQQQYPQGVPPPQFPPHQGATTPLYHAPPGAPLYQAGYGAPPPGHQGQWPPHHMQHPYGPGVTSAPPGQPYPQPGHPADYSHPAVTQTHTSTGAHHSQQMSPSSSMPVGMTASGGSGGHPDVESGSHGDTASHGSLPSSTHSLPGGDEAGMLSPHQEEPSHHPRSPTSGQFPASVSSPTSHYHANRQDGGTAASPSGNSPGAATLNIPSEGEQDKSAAQQENAGFFISFDSESPRRQKPKLPSHKKKNNGGAEEGLVAEPPTMKQKQPPMESTPKRPQTPPQLSPQRPVVRTPGVGFVIDADDEVQQQPDPSDMEKKKQRILQQQLKRREEQEKKRQKAEQARARKEAQKREKQEAAEQKKAEEKARREAIFAQYLMKKADADNTDEDAKPAPPVKKRERIRPKGQRPKSQPPVPYGAGVAGGVVGGTGHGDDRNSASSHSHSSQEDLTARGNHGPMSLSGPDQTDAGYPLAYGGLTHRRPPSPVWRKPKRPGLLMRRVLPGTKMHAESLPSRLDKSGQSAGQGDAGGDAGSNTEYHGPKLFVKPSQKSNRHIIGNAISHCCLAGVVNNDIKNKVLEEVQRSESKHFIILFRDGGQQFRSIYTYNPEREEVSKLLGTGPKQLHNKMMERFYKYNSGSKSFSEVTSTKHLSVSIDAVTIQNHYWQKKPIVRKGGPNMY